MSTRRNSDAFYLSKFITTLLFVFILFFWLQPFTLFKWIMSEVSITDVVTAYLADGCRGIEQVLDAVSKDRKEPRFIDDERDIMVYIQRSKNANVVCYKGVFDNEEPLATGSIDSYWLDVDPAYIEANRKKGKMDNRCDFNIIERKLAYGVSSPHIIEAPNAPISNDVARSSKLYSITFVALPSKVMALARFQFNGEHLPVAMCMISGKLSVVCRIFVQSTEPKHFYQLPKVEYVDIFGWCVEDGTAITERIVA